MSQIVFMSGNGLMKTFTVGESAEMKAGAPAVLVEVGREVVIAEVINDGRVLCSIGVWTNCLVRVAYSALLA